MRVTINVADVTPGQWSWLLRHVDTVWPLGAGGLPVCVTFEGPEGELLHREVGAHRWIEIMTELKRVSETVEAALSETAGAVPEYSRIATNTGHGHVWERPDGFRARCGGVGLCGECKADLTMVES